MSIDQLDIETFVTAKMQQQQAALLQVAAKNAEDIVAQKIKESNAAIKDVIDDEVAG